jgi:hypothetical protein
MFQELERRIAMTFRDQKVSRVRVDGVIPYGRAHLVVYTCWLPYRTPEEKDKGKEWENVGVVLIEGNSLTPLHTN